MGDRLREGAVVTRVRWVNRGAWALGWRCRPHDRVVVLLSVFPPVWPSGCVRYWSRQMVHVDAAASVGPAVSGCVGGRARGRLRFALPENWGRSSFVGWGCFTRVL